MDNLKDVLFLMPKKPDPPYEDGTVLIYYYLTKFLENMNIIYFEDPSKTYKHDPLYPSYELNHNITTIKLSQKEKNKLSFINGYDIDMNYYFEDKSLNQILDYIESNGIKVVFCNITLLKYAEKIKKLTNCLVILHSIDAKSMVERSVMKNSDTKEFIKSVLKFRLYRGIEKKFTTFDKIIVVSDIDREYLLESLHLDKRKVSTVTNGVDLDFFHPLNTKYENEKFTLGFSGIMDYYPNLEGAKYFLNDIFPKLLSKIDDVEFYIIGKNPPKELQDLSQKFKGKVKVTGFVNDIREYLNRLDVYISPLNSGGGIKNKVLEAMAMELPIIASATSVSGIEYNDEIIVYKNNDDFILKIFELYNSKTKRVKLAKTAREYVDTNYSWKAKAVEYHNIINKMKLEGREN
ncbi:glycosyltransferase [Bacillus sp. EB106-08-02-XG196]|uniref:glycosyltransferase n=1 Tax=Bacillus sp. EB106-08-02-XG196 TaxID=2737049 RepID=UPI0015C4D3A1|nr:glycosyltransferase [Bacillus sp. EB106-08-02-XG196]NWQ39502.1 glycosyltransferase [Bacillus sp. EB106-08-02-XG196]